MPKKDLFRYFALKQKKKIRILLCGVLCVSTPKVNRGSDGSNANNQKENKKNKEECTFS